MRSSQHKLLGPAANVLQVVVPLLPIVLLLASCGGSSAATGPVDKVTRSSGCSSPVTIRPGTSTATIESDGTSRTFQLDVPSNYSGRSPFGLVLALHPLTISYTYMPSVMRFATDAGKYHFIGVAPSGLLDHGSPYWYAAPTASNYDIDFISTLVGHLEATMCIDPSRVLSTGISNGAQMSSLLGCRLSGTIAAIAPVEGEEFLSPCRGRPEPILAFHGTADPILPYRGGLSATMIANLDYWKGKVPPGLPKPMGIDQSMQLWAAHNGCAPRPIETQVRPHVLQRTWKGCRASTTLYIVEGGGHGWPGQPIPAEEKAFGPDTTEIDATNLILTFFQRTT